MASRTTQKILVNEFMALTGVNEKVATKLLKAANWKLDQAGDSYYASNGSGSFVKDPDTLTKQFDSLTHGASDEKDVVGAQGTMEYMQALGCDAESTCEWFVPMEIVQSKALAEMNKDGFVDGWKALGMDTLSKQRTYVRSQINKLSTDPAVFKKVYRYAFTAGKNAGQKALEKESAIIYWRLLFTPPGRTWASANVNWLDLWCDYIEQKWTKTVNRDMWFQTYEFVVKSTEDEALSFWSEDGAWPGVIDEFVAYAKEKNGLSEPMAID